MKISATQQKILEVGKQEFLTKGFKDASLRKIVAEAGFSKGAFYGYYPDKAALFEALVSEAADGLIEQFKAALGSLASSTASKLSTNEANKLRLAPINILTKIQRLSLIFSSWCVK